MIIQIVGLPGSGKTTLAKALKERINAIHLNADEVRADINSDLGFSEAEREEQSRRLGAMARLLSNQGHDVIVDFVCPTKETRIVFGKPDILVWMNTIREGRFLDTNRLWQDPEHYDHSFEEHISVDDMVADLIEKFALFDWSAPTTLMLGRYQPWHEGHQMLRDRAAERTDQVLIGVRNTYNTSEKDPLPYDMVEKLIYDKNSGYVNLIKRLPNITNIVYGRDVGYKIEQIDLPAEIQAISATQKRKEMGI
jgi:adenylate kinase family enzyme